jgi:universal stress protein A
MTRDGVQRATDIAARAREVSWSREVIRMTVYSTVLVPMDFSSHSLAALREARDLALKSKARLLMLYVLEESDDAMEFLEDARDSFDRLVPLLDGLEHSMAVRIGPAGDQILRHAAETRADVIVMASRPRGVIQHLLDPSVTRYVTLHASCPVISVQPRVPA